MKRTISRLTSYLLIPIFLLFSIVMFPMDVYAINPFNATDVTVGTTNETGRVTVDTNVWYRFVCPAGNAWIIARLTGVHENGVMLISIFDNQLNLIKENYTQAGNHIAEIVCRMYNEGVGSKEEFIPRLMAGATYYIRIAGTGQYNLNLDQYMDDHYGNYELAAALGVGTTMSGMLERDEDIDSFYFDVPNNYSYKVSVTATKKMDVDIADKNEYVLNNNSLRVLRDNSTAEYTVSGSGVRRYFFLSGKGGTYYTINISIDYDASQLGLWTKVRANTGGRTIRVQTQRGAKISIIVKKGKNNSKILINYNRKRKKKISVTQKRATKTYNLTRRLRPGDVVIVTATKKRYKEFNYKKKMR